MDSVSVSYHSSVLYQSDIALLLDARAWLNDACLTFWSEYLTHGASCAPPLVACVHPSAVALALWEDDEADRFQALRPLALHTVGCVLLPLCHGGDRATPQSGGHWSLLAFHRRELRAAHYDSGGGGALSREVARAAWARLWPLVHGGCGDAPPPPPIVDGSCPQQTDGFSCGVIVAALSERLARRAADGLPPHDDSVLTRLTQRDVESYRREMSEVAQRLAGGAAPLTGQL